jgi:hypothetical protein
MRLAVEAYEQPGWQVSRPNPRSVRDWAKTQQGPGPARQDGPGRRTSKMRCSWPTPAPMRSRPSISPSFVR